MTPGGNATEFNAPGGFGLNGFRFALIRMIKLIIEMQSALSLTARSGGKIIQGIARWDQDAKYPAAVQIPKQGVLSAAEGGVDLYFGNRRSRI